MITHILQYSHFPFSLDFNHLAQIALGNGSSDGPDRSDLSSKRVTHSIYLYSELGRHDSSIISEQLTLTVRSFQTPSTSGTLACPPNLPCEPTSRDTRDTSSANVRSDITYGISLTFVDKNRCSSSRNRHTMPLTVVFNSAISPDASTSIVSERSPRATAYIVSYYSTASSHDAMTSRSSMLAVYGVGPTYLGDLGDTSHLRSQVCRQGIDDRREIPPCAFDTLYDCLTTKSSFRTDLQRHAFHFYRKCCQAVHHRIDDIFELGHGLTFDGDDNLLCKVTSGDGLICQLGRSPGFSSPDRNMQRLKFTLQTLAISCTCAFNSSNSFSADMPVSPAQLPLTGAGNGSCIIFVGVCGLVEIFFKIEEGCCCVGVVTAER